MFKILVITIILPALLAAADIERGGKIVGGTQAKIGAFPYQVAILLKNGEMYCGGSVLTANIVLTAAHCKMPKVADFKIVAGSNSYKNYSATGQERQITKFLPHENYTDGFSGWDIALVKVATPFVLNAVVKPIALTTNKTYLTGAVISTGWGRTKHGEPKSIPEFLQVVTLNMFPYAECLHYWDKLPKNVYCAWSFGKGTCSGDSGSPLVRNVTGELVQVGLTSFGRTCGEDISVFTQVAAYVDWITKNKSKL